MQIKEVLKEKILILDGAMGTLIQSQALPSAAFYGNRFANASVSLVGNHDILNLTSPQVISTIHRKYIEAGADIITTNTFSSNRISQKEYACEDVVWEMAYAGAQLARKEADACTTRKIWVAGSMGPTSKTLSLAADMGNPTDRSVDFDQLAAAYREQAEALWAGGVDLLLLETCFDALNAKAALYAIEQLNEKLGVVIPVMVSATINDRSGRTLTGQTLEAFYISISHYPILSFGLNCSFGVTELRPFIEQLSRVVPAFISIHPNAGLPNEMGEYDELPAFTAHHLKTMAEAGLLNIAGGCCGTTDKHIRAISDALRGLKPRTVPTRDSSDLWVSGLEPHRVTLASPLGGRLEGAFTNVGERTNVAGSRKFARLIAEKKYEEATQIARHQIEGGASIIDINMDDAMLDSRQEMRNFVRYLSNDPAAAGAALMIDSSDWPTVIEGLKNAQGKCIVNSISLKEGEQLFIEKARELLRLGAAVVVMAFDEEGQATTYARKIAIAERAYRSLTAIGFPPQDIIFDVNILSVGTGIAEHAHYGIDFIRAVTWIKENLPYAKTSGGVSNLSFAFRGNNVVREAMHSAFLYHAVRAGLDMGIVNPTMLQVYDEIEPRLLNAVEDVILNRHPQATEVLIALAEELKQTSSGTVISAEKAQLDWRSKPVEERVTLALCKGQMEFLSQDIVELLHAYGDNPVEVIEKPLMRAMERVGSLFAEGKMFLPQVVKSAQVMKEAVTILQPYIDQHATETGEQAKKPLVILATANGDVHDIGKNIVGIVLACNHFDVHDLGVMVSNETILAETLRLKPCMVGVSGLITPSLKEMENLCRLFQQHHLQVPLLVGGATTSAVHTAVKLAPLYDYVVAYGGDASYTSVLAKKLLTNREQTIQEIKTTQQEIRTAYETRHYEVVPYEDANRQAQQLPPASGYVRLEDLQPYESLQPSIADVEKDIDWRMFLLFWGYRGESLQQLLVNPEAEKTLREGREWLEKAKREGILRLQVLLHFENARRQGNDICFSDGTVMPMLRSQRKAGAFLSLADFLDSDADSPVGLFCVVADTTEEYADKKSYDSLMNHALRARLAEACVSWIQHQVYDLHSKRVIRPAFGYPVCPDHSLKQILFQQLHAEERLGVRLTPQYSIQPSTTVCGLFIAHPEARYFTIGRIDEQQLADYCRRRGITFEEGRSLLDKYVIPPTTL